MREDDDVDVVVRRRCTYAPAEFEPVDARHLPIGDDNRKMLAGKFRPGCLAIERADSFMAEFFQDRPECSSRDNAVIRY